jgi:hypothetical protein
MDIIDDLNHGMFVIESLVESSSDMLNTCSVSPETYRKLYDNLCKIEKLVTYYKSVIEKQEYALIDFERYKSKLER